MNPVPNNMLLSDPYFIISLLSAIVVLTMGVCLFTVSMPSGPQLHNYRLSRRLLGTAYIFLAGIHFAGVFINSDIHVSTIVASFQALMFTYALIVLINNRFVTRRRLLTQLSIIIALAAIVLADIFAFPEPIPLVEYAIHAIYASLYVHYVWIFFREYRNYMHRADNFYSGDEYKRLRWVIEVFIMAAVVGIFGGVLKQNNIYFLIFIVGYTVLYFYLAIRYVNYVGQFYRMAPVVAEPQERKRCKDDRNVKGPEALAQWVEHKEYLRPDITLETLADELCVTSSWLSRHINSTYGQNFRSWMASRRVGEAIRLLETRPDLKIDEIQEHVCLSSSSFFRQFHSATGVTPAEYRSRLSSGDTSKL